MTRAGELRERATFEKEEQVPDGGGGFETEWVAQFTCWARLMPGSVAERLEAGRLEASATAILRVRMSPDTETILPSWRVVIAGVEYQIRQHPVDPYRDGQWLDMLIERGVGT